MKKLVLALLCLSLVLPTFAKDEGYKVKYNGGSLSNVKDGDDVRLVIQGNELHIIKDKKDIATVLSSSVTEISYGQDVHRRVGTAVAVGVASFGLGALVALSKSKKHFVGLTWANGDAKGGFAMQCDKDNYRGILAGLEGVTGKKAVDSDALNVKN